MKKKIKRLCYSAIAATSVIAVAVGMCNYLIVHNAKGRLYWDVDSIPSSEVGLLLGTTPQTRMGRKTNLFFKYRIEAAESLYKASKIKSILVSGDEHSLDGISEVRVKAFIDILSY